MRLFVALELPESYLLALSVWRASIYGELREFRLPDLQNMHVTLVFLGYQAERDAERIAELCFDSPPGVFELRPTGVGGLPQARPRLHALELEDAAGVLGAWQSEMSQRFATAKLYKPEKRPFRPHVTLARARRGRECEAAAAPLPALPARLGKSFRASNAVLFRSTLLRSGAVYEPVATLELK